MNFQRPQRSSSKQVLWVAAMVAGLGIGMALPVRADQPGEAKKVAPATRPSDAKEVQPAEDAPVLAPPDRALLRVLADDAAVIMLEVDDDAPDRPKADAAPKATPPKDAKPEEVKPVNADEVKT